MKRFEVWLVRLDPTEGAEMRKTRPCVVLSPDDLNQSVRTALAAPLTSKGRSYPWRVECVFDGRPGQVALDHIRSLPEKRFLRLLGTLDAVACQEILRQLHEMFRP
ncbi:MAG: type II toxin-antitoxin system PemK/MazF family toxin [Verrucomicrobia bacterium]|nr:type II toxin-antitoxin system PemK/MazF family toxin [Verrucomicrobiota bacterium]